MFEHLIKFRLILLICILIKFTLCTKSILLCYKGNYEINCTSAEQYIIINDAVFGYLPSFIKSNIKSKNWCSIPDAYRLSQPKDCSISLMKNISNKCSGIQSCKLDVMYSQYLQKDILPCLNIANNYEILTLYVSYECVPKSLFYSIENLQNIHFIGGYITSAGYFALKSNAHEEYKDIFDYFREKDMLPINMSFRPKIQLGILNIFPIVFQFQILENTLYSYQDSSNRNNTNTCQMGIIYSQDYYAFTIDKVVENNSLNSSIIICQSSRDMVGETIEPMIAEQINVISNVKFTISSNVRKGLLIKFTAIFCPPLSIANANITYDNRFTDDIITEVTGFAKILCKPGYFLFPSYIRLKDNSTHLDCNHETRLWESSPLTIKCSRNEIITTSPVGSTRITNVQSSTSATSITSVTDNVTFLNSTSTNFSNESIIPISLITGKDINFNPLTKYLLPSVIILLICLFIFGYILYRKKGKIKCISSNCTSISKIFVKKENRLNHHYMNNHHVNPSIGYQQVMDSMTPMFGSLRYIGHGFSSNGSCRQSNRTLTTRVDSKPTITSRDSFPPSSNISDLDINQIRNEDELPRKIPKQSPMMRIISSANSFRNHSLRPMSLSRHPYDRNSNISDGRFSSSQIALLKSRRNNINSESFEIPSIMWTSDISPSKTNSRYITQMKSDSDLNPHSQPDVCFKFNPKVYSPTIDTYLEPNVEIPSNLEEKDSLQFSQQSQRKKSEDYMIYDHSRISSNNIDSTCPSSINESSVEVHHAENDENKRFSMISNNYYGLQRSNSRSNTNLLMNNDSIHETTNNNVNYSIESDYESIDDDPLINIRISTPRPYQSTLERRKIALPSPPDED